MPMTDVELPLTCLELALAAFALGLAVLRVAGVKGKGYQAIAHVFVGGLFGASSAGAPWVYLWLAVGLTVVEVVVFLMGRLVFPVPPGLPLEGDGR